jgi:CHAT domain-containing protein/tetratricopeptide (TPR) repeat protein
MTVSGGGRRLAGGGSAHSRLSIRLQQASRDERVDFVKHTTTMLKDSAAGRLFILSLVVMAWSHAAAQEVKIPARMWECETRDHEICGTWSFTGANGTGEWRDGSVADLIVQQFDSTWVIIRRSDSSGISPGLIANYVGKLNGDRVEGTVTWIWIGHWTGPIQGKWHATLHELKTDDQGEAPPAHALETGRGVSGRAPDTPTVPGPSARREKRVSPEPARGPTPGSPPSPRPVELAEKDCVPQPDRTRPAPRQARPAEDKGGEPGPFNFREAYLLEHRLVLGRQAAKYDPYHSENWLQYSGPSPARQSVPDKADANIYKDTRWLGLLKEADRFQGMGGFKVAEARYLLILGMLEKVLGPCSNAVAYMLDHLGEAYLESREFELAYARLSAAVEVRRRTIRGEQAEDARDVERLHLLDLLTRLGQMDLGRGDLEAADEKLAEAASISNEKPFRRYVPGLYAIYFRSLLLERQNRWQEAEKLWREAAEARDHLKASDPYWNALKETAAFYARHRGIHRAASIAREVVDKTDGKALNPELAVPYLDSRPRAEEEQPRYSRYRALSDIAMSEILALDAWQTSGSASAAAILKEPRFLEDLALDSGADSDRGRLLAWVGRRVFLHMSILLDGEPSAENVARAYDLLTTVKGRFLGSQRTVMRRLEEVWYNTHMDFPQVLAELSQLSQERALHAHLFMAQARDGKPVDMAQLAGVERTEAAIAEALAASSAAVQVQQVYPLRPSPPAGSALLDFVEWQRTDRRTLTLLPSEYGVFVSTRGAPVRFVRLGPAAEIDRDIDLITATYVGSDRVQQALEPRRTDLSRGARALGAGSDRMKLSLERLYQKVLAPLSGWLPYRSPREQPPASIFVIPDGKLTLAPLAAFIGPDGRYFLEDHRVSYVVDAGVFRQVISDGGLRSRAVVFANPDFTMPLGGYAAAPPWPSSVASYTSLPNFEPEAADVAKALNLPPDHVLRGKMAREEVVRGLLGPRLLHFATHSEADIGWHSPAAEWDLFEFPPPASAQNPLLRSVIALAGANREQAAMEDGLLTALEVQSLHLAGTQLVVLSSCESGRDTIADGLGLQGLRAAFWKAGAEGLVTNLWQVHDEAARRFMRFFYAHLRDPGGPAEALRQAQLEMIKTSELTAPFYWAGYTYMGLSQPLNLEPAVAPEGNEKEVLVSPSCFEVGARRSDGDRTYYLELRVKLGPMARLRKRTSTSAVYELLFPGSEVERSWSISINNGPPVMDIDSRVASWLGDEITLTVDRSNGQSSVVIQTLTTRTAKGTPIVTLTLKGDAGLFPSLAVPDAFPPVGAYRVATVDDKPEAIKIDLIKSCGIERSAQ